MLQLEKHIVETTYFVKDGQDIMATVQNIYVKFKSIVWEYFPNW